MLKGLRSWSAEKLFRIMQNEVLSTLQHSHGESLQRLVAIHGSSWVSTKRSPVAHAGRDEPA